MRFAIKTAPQHTTFADMLAVWKAADEIELFESAWVFDHFYPIFSDPTGPCLEAWVTLSAMAQATDRIRIGSMVNGMPYRHPAITANMAATLDEVSGGRLELGLGAGWNEEEADAYGISLGATLTDRFDMFDEGVEAIIALLSNEMSTLHGSYVYLTDARCTPDPVQKPHPPIVIGGGGEKRTLRAVARFAQHWNLPWADPEVWKHKRAVLDQHCADVGRDPAEIMNSLQIALGPDDDPITKTDQVAVLEDLGIDLTIFSLAPPHSPATIERIAEVFG
ncbi:MAG: LLM class F420-dependent oxidoreductase [Acidimicrobiales bacterium]|nr:LLM class F420-dependent oxidoreductase [Acidimicrobiales bacterium]